MAASIGLILAATIYLITIAILFKTSGFRKKVEQPRTFLHFRNKAIPLELGVIGLFNLLIGLIWLSLWTFFMFTRWDTFQIKFYFLLSHVLIQLFTSLGLVVSGIATIAEWERWKLIYILGLILLVGSTLVSLIFYGPYGHGEPLSMMFLGVWSFCVAGIMTFGFFILHRLLSSSRSLPPDHRRT
ncbi:MAG: hypothetical protein AB7F59_10570 [Bdellovibrionales bacterium]